MNGKNKQYLIEKLSEIKRLSSALDTAEREYSEKIVAFRVEFTEKTVQTRSDLDAAEADLKRYLKNNKADIFPGKTDRVVIDGGVLLHQIANLVRKARHITVDFLRGKELNDGIRTEEFVDWPKIENWTDDQLALIGTERRKKETFAYELTGAEPEKSK